MISMIQESRDKSLCPLSLLCFDLGSIDAAQADGFLNKGIEAQVNVKLQGVTIDDAINIGLVGVEALACGPDFRQLKNPSRTLRIE